MKRLLLFSLIFALALSACGGGNRNDNDDDGKPNQDATQKVDAGQKCTQQAVCNDGLACIPSSGSTDEGVCEPTCDNGTCSDSTTKECITGITDLGGQSVDICREKAPVEPVKGKLDDACSAKNECDEGLVCVANAGTTEEGTCQTKCPEGTCDGTSKTCQNVPGLGSDRVDACLPEPVINEGEECRENDVCEENTICLAKQGHDKIGICTKATPCDINAPSCAKPNHACYSERGLNGLKLAVCLPQWCYFSSNCKLGGENRFCAVTSADYTRGHCKEQECNPQSNENECGEGKICVEDIFSRRYQNEQKNYPGMCVDREREDWASPIGDDCSDTKPCQDSRLSCVNQKCSFPCDVPGFQTQCRLTALVGDNTTDWCVPGLDETNHPGQMFCTDISSIPESWRTAKLGEPCGRDQICDTANNLHCLIDYTGSGKCVEINPDDLCEQDADCNGKKCKIKYSRWVVLGWTENNNYFDNRVKTCQD